MSTLDTIARNIVKALKQKQSTVTFAESCTGGRLAAALTSISGASDVFEGSMVTYANRIKHEWISVRQSTLERYGAVSEACVREMLEGVKHRADADYAVAISGIAGPTGGTPEKPVGTVFIGIATPKKREVYHCLFRGTREMIQNASVRFALEKLLEFLQDN